jgi:hypothetical protein
MRLEPQCNTSGNVEFVQTVIISNHPASTPDGVALLIMSESGCGGDWQKLQVLENGAFPVETEFLANLAQRVRYVLDSAEFSK